MDKEQRIKEIEKEFTKLGMIDAIPMIMIGLAFYAKFSNEKELIFKFLENDSIVNGMLGVSIPIVLWCIYRAIKLAIEKSKLTNS
ncbi:MAG: hypothetical protein HWE16_18990 [Gammaproteobacteria bacterium]|nr:hypothetical protein [Gammaproteobacteria bacterium]